MVFDALDHPRQPTEADAYAAVGAAVRELKRSADAILATIGEVPTT